MRLLDRLHGWRTGFERDPAGFIAGLAEPWRTIGLVELAGLTWITRGLHRPLRPHWRRFEVETGRALAAAFDEYGDFLAAAEAQPGHPGLLRLSGPAARTDIHGYDGPAPKARMLPWNGWAAFKAARAQGLPLGPGLQAAWPPAGPRLHWGGAAAFAGPKPQAYARWLERIAPPQAGPEDRLFVVEVAGGDPASLASLEQQDWKSWRLADAHQPTPQGAATLRLEAGDTLLPGALAALAEALREAGTAAAYGDEDRIGPADPVFKPGYDAERLKSQDYIGGAIARVAEHGAVRHVPRILWRRTASPQWPIVAAPEPAPATWPRVTVIVPTRDRADLLRGCAEGLLARTDYPDLELCIVDNGSADPEAVALLAELAGRPRVKVMRLEGPFDFAGMNNAAAQAAGGEVLAFVNDDTLVIDPAWLRRMVALAVRDDVGAVGAKLFYPDGRIQHAGVVLGLGAHGVAGHILRGAPGTWDGPQGMLRVVREASAVTAACLVVETRKFLAVGGFDAALQVAFNDVDLCLRLRERGWKTLWTPHARMVHLESASRSRTDRTAQLQAEAERMRQRWGARLMADPYRHPMLSGEIMALSAAPQTPRSR